MKPRIFLASSVEGKRIAEVLQANLDYDAVSTVWDQAFTLSTNTIDKLLHYCTDNDFAVFVFHDDDVANIRGTDVSVARDNVVFECGMFIGMHGKDSAFVVAPRNANLHLPTDLLGYTPTTYDPDRTKTLSELRAALGRATTDIRTAIEESEWTNLRPAVSFTRIAGGKTYPLKLAFQITNNQREPTRIESLAFDIGRNLRLDNKAPKLATRNRYKPRLLVKQIQQPDGTTEDLYEDWFILEPGKTVKSWVPFAPDIGKASLEAAANKRAAGSWHYRCSWFGHRVINYNYSHDF
jgi:hypothetical protein